MTPAYIGYIDAEGRALTLRIDRDGMPSEAGRALLERYNTFDAIQALVLSGNFAGLYADGRQGELFRGYRYDFPNSIMALLCAVDDDVEYLYLFEYGAWIVYLNLQYPGTPLYFYLLEREGKDE